MLNAVKFAVVPVRLADSQSGKAIKKISCREDARDSRRSQVWRLSGPGALPAANRTKPNGDPMLVRTLAVWGTSQRPTLPGVLWMAVLLGTLVWLNGLHDGIFLAPPFAVTLTTLLYLPNVAIAQPFAVIVGSTTGAAIGTLLSLLVGFGPGVAMLAAIASLVVLPLLRAYHPPGIALAMFPPLLIPAGGLRFRPCCHLRSPRCSLPQS